MAQEARRRHSLGEDLFSQFVGTLFFGFGLILLEQHGLLTGGTAGLAVVVVKLSGFSLGWTFFFVNLPFYWLAVARKGSRFVINTFVSVSLVSVWTGALPQLVIFDSVSPYLAATLGGCLLGTGLLILFRHGSSLGGIGILAIYLQDRYAVSAGRVQMVLDVVIVGAGFFLVSIPILALSVIGVLALNLVIALNYKPGRYEIA